MSSPEPPAPLRKGYVDTRCAGCLCCLLFLFVAANIFIIGYVHWQMIYLQPNGSPGVQQNAIYYYTYLDPTLMPPAQFLNAGNIGPADYLSGTSLALYGEDLLRFFVPLLAAGWVMLAVPCNSDSTTVPIVIIVIFSLYELGKGLYLIFVNYSTFSTTQCSEFPFCTSRDSSTTHNTADATFTTEAWACFAFFIYDIIVAVVLSRSIIHNSAYDSGMRTMLLSQSKTPAAAGIDSDSDDGRPMLHVREQEALVVDTRSTRRRAPPTKQIEHDIPRILVTTEADEFYS